MKNKRFIRITVFFLLLTVSFTMLLAGGGNDHSHSDEKTTPEGHKQNYFSSEAVSDKYELLIRYEPIPIGEPARLTLFVSEYATNKPVDKAEIKIKAQEDSKLIFTVQQTDLGIYSVETTFPEKRNYSLAVSINSTSGPDLILISNIQAGQELPHAEATGQPWAMGIVQTILLVAFALLAGLALGILFQKRNTGRGRQVSALILLLTYCLIPVELSIAHGDDDHGTGKTGNVFSNTFYVPKETQFLFDVFTEKVLKRRFTESTKLFGTIIPSSNGQALVTAPQSGKIILLNVRVGEQVKAGQQLAVMEQNLDAGTQINLLAEKNNIIAEYDAARKEFERLNAIKDIAARREVDEAAARLQKAENNLKLFNSTSGRITTLNAPISGTVGNFKLSEGSTVNTGETLFTITNLMQVYAEAQVFDKDADKIQKGAAFSIECANDCHKTSEVKLLSLAQEINPANQTQRVLFELNNTNMNFKIGEFVNIRIFNPENSQQIALPNSAIREINGKPVVFIKDAAEKYTVSYVQTGENNGTFTRILKGVEEGERVVVNAGYQLKMIYLNQ